MYLFDLPRARAYPITPCGLVWLICFGIITIIYPGDNVALPFVYMTNRGNTHKIHPNARLFLFDPSYSHANYCVVQSCIALRIKIDCNFHINLE